MPHKRQLLTAVLILLLILASWLTSPKHNTTPQKSTLKPSNWNSIVFSNNTFLVFYFWIINNVNNIHLCHYPEPALSFKQNFLVLIGQLLALTDIRYLPAYLPGNTIFAITCIGNWALK